MINHHIECCEESYPRHPGHWFEQEKLRPREVRSLPMGTPAHVSWPLAWCFVLGTVLLSGKEQRLSKEACSSLNKTSAGLSVDTAPASLRLAHRENRIS